MSEEEKKVAAEPTGKDAIYVKLAEMVKDKTGKNIGKTGGRKLFDAAIDEAIALACREGSLRLNGGFGSLQVKEYGAGSRQLPNGTKVEFGERKKLRYEQGVVVAALVENGGDLEEAYKARGSRSTDTEEAAEPKEHATEGEATLD